MKFLSLPTSHSINNALFSSSSSSSFPLLRRIFLTPFARRRIDKSYLTFPPKRSFCNCSGNSGIGGRDFSSAGRGMGADQGYGEIHVIVGPMFAGKTTTLLRRIHDEKESGRIVAVIKSDKDIRYDERSIVTHDGVKMPCWPLSNLSSFKTVIGLEAYRKLEVIGIDEAQFFEDLYDFCQLAADNDGKTIIVAGLDGDYLRRNFGSILDIVPLADSVTKLKAQCGLCGHHASFTLRKSRDTQTELIGGSDVYMPVCRQHYVKGQVVIETTRTILESQLIHESYIEAAPASS